MEQQTGPRSSVLSTPCVTWGPRSPMSQRHDLTRQEPQAKGSSLPHKHRDSLGFQPSLGPSTHAACLPRMYPMPQSWVPPLLQKFCCRALGSLSFILWSCTPQRFLHLAPFSPQASGTFHSNCLSYLPAHLPCGRHGVPGDKHRAKYTAGAQHMPGGCIQEGAGPGTHPVWPRVAAVDK